MTKYRINRLGQYGDGIADGPLYAPMTLPGEVIEATAEGTTLTGVKIVTPSDVRVAPPCRHFKACGGCQMQHASDAFVAEWKTDLVQTALKAHALETDIKPVLTSPRRSRRRASFSARRTKKGAMAGLFGRGSDVIIEVPDCMLMTGDVMRGRKVAKELALACGTRKGTLSVQVTSSTTGLDVAVTGGKPLNGALRVELARLSAKLEIARLSWEDETIATLEQPVQVFGRARVVPPPGAFLQATRDGEADLLGAVRIGVKGANRIADLFAGVGTFALPLAEVCEVHAVEGQSRMLIALDQGWRMAPGLKAITTEARDLFRRPLLPDELKRYDAVVLDPPRAGAEAQVAELVHARVPRIVYVSCNPVTFARDVAHLCKAGYVLDWVQPVDQFRWSSHLELVGVLTFR